MKDFDKFNKVQKQESHFDFEIKKGLKNMSNRYKKSDEKLKFAKNK